MADQYNPDDLRNFERLMRTPDSELPEPPKFDEGPEQQKLDPEGMFREADAGTSGFEVSGVDMTGAQPANDDRFTFESVEGSRDRQDSSSELKGLLESIDAGIKELPGLIRDALNE